MGNTKSTSNKIPTAANHGRLPPPSVTEPIKLSAVDVEDQRWAMSDKDIAFLSAQTGCPSDEIIRWHKRFFRDNPDGRLDRSEFRKVYPLLRNETPERLNDICDHVFRAFDVDGNGYVEFGEFLLGFAISSRGDLRARLNYAFECYDVDSNGYLTEDEVELVIRAMYTLLGIRHIEDYPPEQFAKDLMKKLDMLKSGRVTKDEFIYFLMQNGLYRTTVNPFQ